MFADPFAAPIAISETGKVSHGHDHNMSVEFYMFRQLQEAETVVKSEPVYKDVPHVRIAMPGAKTVVDKPVDFVGNGCAPDPERWPKQWERFQAGQKQLNEGSPLSDMGLGPNEIKNLECYNIHTVEHLAHVPDGLVTDLGMGMRGVRDSAIKWLKNKESRVDIIDAQSQEISDLAAKLEAQSQEISHLADKLQTRPVAESNQSMLEAQAKLISDLESKIELLQEKFNSKPKTNKKEKI